jgi:hypothetical protein
MRSANGRFSCCRASRILSDTSEPAWWERENSPPSKNGGAKSMPDGVPCVGTCEGEQRLGLGFYSLEWGCQNGRRDLVNAERGLRIAIADVRSA